MFRSIPNYNIRCIISQVSKLHTSCQSMTIDSTLICHLHRDMHYLVVLKIVTQCLEAQINNAADRISCGHVFSFKDEQK
jgi:hypothetical protein